MDDFFLQNDYMWLDLTCESGPEQEKYLGITVGCTCLYSIFKSVSIFFFFFW